ncbi:MAG: hypothetical protein AVDCRST_MAG51-1703, partial [uncultured Ramlibacter sp.]
ASAPGGRLRHGGEPATAGQRQCVLVFDRLRSAAQARVPGRLPGHAGLVAQPRGCAEHRL